VTKPEQNELEGTLIEITVEGWRIGRVFAAAVSKLDAGESPRYLSQLRYFLRRVEGSLEQVGLRIVNLEGQPYDAGIAATALNASDFGPDDELFVHQMIEPLIMSSEGVRRCGVVMLRKRDA